LKINWPDERLPNFQSLSMSVIPFGGGPGPRARSIDLEEYRTGMQRTKAMLESILRNEKDLAEAQEDTSVTELFRPPGSQHDAYSFIRQIISEAAREILIADNYVDSTIFTLLTNASSGVAVSILTYNVPADFKLECDKFRRQHPIALETRRRSVDFHDRFIIVDGDKAYHLGASIKDAGDKASMIHLIEDADNVNALLGTYRTSWVAARVL
jgi:sugar-specific transcriptional regulator TrmB